ncbi:kinase-like protein [Gigaspora margarita]|uniref:Kinase-like protein n=1 Tax=Gigaspora margarita TaxID=4874 RepID=A0A8H4AJ25_GIGMA|nr:kinase-like protein [Gigaspora margarita]
MMIADFGLSKRLDETSAASRSKAQGLTAYVDPQCFIIDTYKRNKLSDIYALGVIFWEITSGRPPFHTIRSQEAIAIQIFQNKRETPVENTPEGFVRLYKRCWDGDPKKRPEINIVYETIECLKSEENLPDLEKLTIQDHSPSENRYLGPPIVNPVLN